MVKITLTPIEARVIGALIEKEHTTPENYPLSLNALTAACNQKSSREPVLNLAESEVRDALAELIRRHLVREDNRSGSRVPKYGQRLSSPLGLGPQFATPELALLCVLMLRGPQTVGELRGRCARIHAFPEVGSVEATLEGLMSREDGPYVARLSRQPGRKESRYVDTLQPSEHAAMDDAPPVVAVVPSGDVASGAGAEPKATASYPQQPNGDDRRPDPAAGQLAQRIEGLEQEVETLKSELARLNDLVTDFLRPS